jgi:hypothetical protein
MKLLRSRRTRHHTVVVVLLVWLFALGSGVANACLLEAPGTHGHEAHAPVAGHDDDASHGARESCLKVCSDGAQSPTTPDLKPVQPDLGPAPLVAVLWNPAEQVAAAPRHASPDPPPATGPPIRFRFARLAL